MRTALITGASRGIGRGIAMHLAAQGYGLTITARRAPELAALAGELRAAGAPSVVHHAADAAERDVLLELVDVHDRTFGYLSALVLNAGVGTMSTVASTRLDRVDKTMSVDFTSPLVLLKHALPLLHEGAARDLERGAKIVATSSIDYELGLFAASSYLAVHGQPSSMSDLAQHSPVYYVESMLQVADLDLVDRLFPRRTVVLGATSVLAQLEMTRRGAGIGLLPVFLAVDAPELVRVLPESTSMVLIFWLSARTENLRRPEVAAVAEAIQEECQRVFAPLARTSTTGRS
jgi:hypothetical protein